MNPLKKRNSFEQKLKENLDGMELKPSDALWEKIAQNISADTFEPKIQEKLSNYTVEPNTETWGKVESQLPENRRKFAWLWISGIATLLIALGGLSYLSLQEPNAALVQTEQNESAAIEKVIPSLTEGNETEANTSSKSIKKAALQKLREVAAFAKENNKPSSTNKKQKAKIIAETHQSKALKQGIVKAKTSTRQSYSTSFEPAPSEVGSNKLPPNPPTAKGNLSQEKPEPSKNAAPLAESSKPSQTDIISAPTQANTTAVKSDSVGYKGKEIEMQAGSSAKDTLAGPSIVSNTNQYLETDANPSKFSLLALLGTHMSFMGIEEAGTSKYDLDKAIALQKEITSSQIDFSGGLQMEYAIGKKWHVRAGIGILSFKEAVQYNVLPVDSAPQQVQPPNFYVNKTDSIIPGTTLSLENKYSFTELPIILGYKALQSEVWNVDINVGASYGRLNLVNAYLADPGCVGLMIANDKNAFPKFKNVWFANLAPSVSWNLNTRTSLGLMPHLRVGLNNMVDNEDWFGQRPWSAGLNFFLRQRF